MGLVPCIAVSTGYILLVLFLAGLVAPLNAILCVQDGAGALHCGVHGLHPPGALPCRAGSPAGCPLQCCNYVCRMGLVPCIAVSTGYILLVLFLAELARQLVAPLNAVIMCAGWGWCPVLRCPRATSSWCSSWPSWLASWLPPSML
jgi:hypothetical protein